MVQIIHNGTKNGPLGSKMAHIGPKNGDKCRFQALCEYLYQQEELTSLGSNNPEIVDLEREVSVLKEEREKIKEEIKRMILNFII